ncbi:nitronate monooxygenase, partial [Hydrogenophaga sp. OTU3427]|uniref:nitronate monooxygenase n=1 Tax=Hydrogenophaga sp. OTU3427 TaxID=3043856 RepID=UPI00313DE7E6
ARGRGGRAPPPDDTTLTNVFTGRPARGIVNRVMREVGPMSELAPAFPLSGGALVPLRAASEPQGSGDFMSLWAGQSVALDRARQQGTEAGALTRRLCDEAQARLAAFAPAG